jgi:hypothetical protein
MGIDFYSAACLDLFPYGKGALFQAKNEVRLFVVSFTHYYHGKGEVLIGVREGIEPS